MHSKNLDITTRLPRVGIDNGVVYANKLQTNNFGIYMMTVNKVSRFIELKTVLLFSTMEWIQITVPTKCFQDKMRSILYLCIAKKETVWAITSSSFANTPLPNTPWWHFLSKFLLPQHFLPFIVFQRGLRESMLFTRASYNCAKVLLLSSWCTQNTEPWTSNTNGHVTCINVMVTLSYLLVVSDL